MAPAIDAASESGGLFHKGKVLAAVAVVSKGIRQHASVRLRLSSQVCTIGLWAKGGKTVRGAFIDLLHVLGDAGLIAFDGKEEIVRAPGQSSRTQSCLGRSCGS